VIVGTVNRLLKGLFREGYRHQKCGVQLSRIQPASIPEQRNLFDLTGYSHAESVRLMQAMDRINRRFPQGSGF
jgi:DNA polymerase V